MTLFYRKHADEHEILEVLALLAEGNRISTLTRVKGSRKTPSCAGCGKLPGMQTNWKRCG